MTSWFILLITKFFVYRQTCFLCFKTVVCLNIWNILMLPRNRVLALMQHKVKIKKFSYLLYFGVKHEVHYNWTSTHFLGAICCMPLVWDFLVLFKTHWWHPTVFCSLVGLVSLNCFHSQVYQISINQPDIQITKILLFIDEKSVLCSK